MARFKITLDVKEEELERLKQERDTRNLGNLSDTLRFALHKTYPGKGLWGPSGYKSPSPPASKKRRFRQILDAIRDLGDDATAKNIAAAVGLGPDRVRYLLLEMLERELVTRASYDPDEDGLGYPPYIYSQKDQS